MITTNPSKLCQIEVDNQITNKHGSDMHATQALGCSAATILT